MIVININAQTETNIILSSISKYVVTVYMYAENPINAKDALSINDAHNPIPLIVPTRGPYVLSRYTYEPPLDGIEEDSSAFESAPGSTIDADIKNASQIPGPIISAANVGITNNPEPSIEESEIMMTPLRLIVRLNLSETFSCVLVKFLIKLEVISFFMTIID